MTVFKTVRKHKHIHKEKAILLEYNRTIAYQRLRGTTAGKTGSQSKTGTFTNIQLIN